MTDRMFIAAMVIAGVGIGAVLAWFPAFRSLNVPPYFWVLIVSALFEGVLFLRGGGAPGTMVTMATRITGFILGVIAAIGVPYLLNVDVRAF